ncbi:TonB-dependent receptor [Pseudoduganella plicata]|uniref:TonB-dependent receptor n=1 Tax=Pseudoduganella plicata TaxID=321984 RepID=A0A4P7BKJ2_9BURK|nr:TonB-dependent receptor [Pseudoduganella plicata]QBQ38853.1 TonB-dependent receptor [Pseudoduganella plicata]GGZ09728.1 TonB-dependent receptor [Pseudoduganella plicata]
MPASRSPFAAKRAIPRSAFPLSPRQAIAAALLAAPWNAWAEPAAAGIPSVEIVGLAPTYGLGIDRQLLPYPVQVASDEALRKAGGENLAEFMARNLTGVNVNEVSGSPFQHDITFRGFRASPVVGSAQGISVYLDGVRVNEAFGDVVHWDMLPEAAIGSLLLVSGASPLYGLNTLGGALALTTKSGLTHPGGEAEFSLTDQGRRRADLAYGFNNADGWHAFAGATWFDDHGWRDHSEGHLANLLIKLGRTRGSTDWSATLLTGRSRLLGNGLLPDALYGDNRRAVYTFPDTTRNRLAQGSFNVTHRFSADSELTAVVYVRNSRRDTVNGDVSEDYDEYTEDCEDGFDDAGNPLDPDGCGVTRDEGAALHPGVLNTTSTRQRGNGVSAAYSTRRGATRIDAGGTFDRSTSRYAQFEQQAFITPSREVIGDPDEEREPSASVTGSARAVGLYVAANWTAKAGTQLTASARWNRARVDNTLTNERGEQPAESFTYTRLNPSLGFVHQLTPGTAVFANVGQGNRVPTVIELGCADPENPCRLPVGLQADPYLKQVIARTVEAGMRSKWQRGGYSVSLHRTVNRDDILFLSAPSRQGYFANFERTRHQGLDLSLAHGIGNVDMRFAYSYLQATYDADGELFTGARHVAIRRGMRLAGLPRHSGKLALDWNANAQWTLGAEVHGVSSLVTQGNEDGLIEDAEPDGRAQRADWRVRGHVLLGMRATYRPSPGWELFARIANVLDRRYETYGAVAPDLFPHGRLVKPHEDPLDAGHTRFVAPGAPRTVIAGIRRTF